MQGRLKMVVIGMLFHIANSAILERVMKTEKLSKEAMTTEKLSKEASRHFENFLRPAR